MQLKFNANKTRLKVNITSIISLTFCLSYGEGSLPAEAERSHRTLIKKQTSKLPTGGASLWLTVVLVSIG
jgi:hypothetical protein